MSETKVILIEFNELVPNLMDRFIAEGHLPFFSRFRRESLVFTTDAQAKGEDLNPWVQWVTVHTGLDLAEHGIKFLSDGCKLDRPAVWDIASENGMQVLVCGSMNGRYDKPLNGYLVPDPWSSGLTCYPPGEFDTFYEYIRTAVQEHTNPDSNARVSGREFVKWMLRHGLSFGTLRRTVAQVLRERLRGGAWRKAVILDRFLFDVFLKYYRRTTPRLATYFSNSTAHFQHKYWRCMEPEVFSSKPSEEDHREHKDAILYGYRQMDDLIRRFLALADENTTLVFCSALGQQPYLGHEDQGGRIYYRLKSSSVLSDKLGLPEGFSYEPVMAEQFFLRYQSEQEASRARKMLAALKTGDQATFHVQGQGRELLVQCQQTGQVSPESVIRSTELETSFFDVFYRIDGTKSGFHHPDGLLWIRLPDRTYREEKEKVPLRNIAPTILELLDTPKPAFMSGESLLSSVRPVMQASA